MLFKKQIFSKPTVTLCALSIFSSSFAIAQSEQEWGLSAAYRSASLVHEFPGTSDTSVSTFVPMFYYQGELHIYGIVKVLDCLLEFAPDIPVQS